MSGHLATASPTLSRLALSLHFEKAANYHIRLTENKISANLDRRRGVIIFLTFTLL
jgi:hypothetical protein